MHPKSYINVVNAGMVQHVFHHLKGVLLHLTKYSDKLITGITIVLLHHIALKLNLDVATTHMVVGAVTTVPVDGWEMVNVQTVLGVMTVLVRSYGTLDVIVDAVQHVQL